MKTAQIGRAKDQRLDICEGQSNYLLNEFNQIIVCNESRLHVHIITLITNMCSAFK